MNFRQVHLDFHTSEKIEGIGKNFDKKQFQEALCAGHVNSITLFSKCHHGWSYHPTKANEMHPHLSFDLLGAQIEAAHEIGVKTPVYISAGLDEKHAVSHKDELVRSRDGKTTWVDGFDSPGYHVLCFGSPYLEKLLSQIKEMLENYDADGVFLDITNVQPCFCKYCVEERKRRGIDESDVQGIFAYAEEVYANYTKRVRETVDSVRPGLPVFHNGGHIRRGRRDLAHANTHLELESLPTGGWGYDHFPVSCAYARALGMEYLGMTGKFHTAWGEFGGFKHPNALRYEVSLSVSNGARCSVGDQLHPSGKMDMATYELIGKAYEELEAKEQYFENASYVSDIAVLGKEALDNYHASKGNRIPEADRAAVTGETGVARILLEGKYLFDYVDAESDLNGYKLLILPDDAYIDLELCEKMRAFVKSGGKILASGKSAVGEDGKFLFDFGAEFDGENEYKPDYCRPCFDIPALSNSAYLMNMSGCKIKNVTGKVLAHRENPYFNRTAEHFCSHKHAPNNPETKSPAIVLGKDGAYIGWYIFSEYAHHGSITSKQIATHVIEELIGNTKTLKTNLPSQGVATVMKQNNRDIVNLLYASPVKRGSGVEVIEDILPVNNVRVEVKKRDAKVKRVYTAVENRDLPYSVEGDYVVLEMPEIECHSMAVIEY